GRTRARTGAARGRERAEPHAAAERGARPRGPGVPARPRGPGAAARPRGAAVASARRAGAAPRSALMRRWAILNTLLGIAVRLLGLEIVRTWARALPPVEVTQRASAPGPEQHEKGKHGGEKATARAQQAQQAPAQMVAEVGEKDLFDLSRRAAPPDEVAKTE